MSRPGKDFVPVNLSKDAEKISLASSASKSVNGRPSGLLFFSPVLSGAPASFAACSESFFIATRKAGDSLGHNQNHALNT